MTTMTRRNHTLQICPERYQQLLALRDALGERTITETVGALIRSEIARGTIPNEIPGVLVDRDRDEVFIAFDNQRPIKFKPKHAMALSDAILNELEGRTATEISIGGGFMVARKGAGIAVQLDMTDKHVKNFTRDIAYDLAHLVREATKG